MAAGLGFKTFTTGEVLTAADVNGYLMQGVLVFADAAARDAAITSPQEGQACYLKDTAAVLTYSGTAWVGFDDSNAIQNAIVDAKGDLIAASAADTPARLAVGTNGFILTADSTAPTGLAWTAKAGPAFRAYRNTDQNLTQNVFTKVQLNAETFDTDSCFDSTTNYRFTPTLAGYYQVNATIMTSGSNVWYGIFYKNGAQFSRFLQNAALSMGFSGSDTIYFNGSTDYLELYIYSTGVGSTVVTGESASFMSASWIRS
jgi:hypothetical protein